MKKIHFILVVLVSLAFALNACNKDDSSKEPELVGRDGNPRFNLQFTNPDNVDLDLYVQTPSGAIIYYSNPFDEGGMLDVDCLCGDCPQGPNENIFWENGTAPEGTYKFWVEYYSACNDDNASSNFTLRVIKNGTILQTKSGTLSEEVSSQVWTYNHTN